MAAMAKHDMAITLMPSMRSRCASMKRLPAMRRMMAAAAAQPAMIRNSLKPEGERRDQRRTEETRA